MPLHIRLRTLVVLTAAVAGCRTPVSGSPRPEAAPSGDVTAHERAEQLLSRLTFGPRPGDVQSAEQLGVTRWLDRQLAPATIPDTLVDRVLGELETQRHTAVELIADHPDPQEVQNLIKRRGAQATAADSALLRRARQAASQLANEIPAAQLVRAVASDRQLQEVMTVFWENHFNVFTGKAPNRYALVEYDRDVIRPRALGKFRDLLGAVAKSPEMLYYLDNSQSTVDSLHPTMAEERIEARRSMASSNSIATAVARLPKRRARGPNENFGRELLELHTLGVDGGYTQADVQDVARAFTGWTIETPQFGGAFVFRPELHDAGEKTILGHRIAAGGGESDGEQVLDLLAAAPATAHFITTKLARHFVSDDPPRALVDRCAAEFTASGGDIGRTVRCIVLSPEFFGRSALRAKVKTPFELVVSTLRILGSRPDTTVRQAQIVAQLGQPIFGKLTPEGWPDRGDAWMNSGAILNRINFGLRAANGQIPGIDVTKWPPFAQLLTQPPAAQVRGVVDGILGGEASAETMDALTTRAAATGETPAARLRALIGLALGSPEFQRR